MAKSRNRIGLEFEGFEDIVALKAMLKRPRRKVSRLLIRL